MNDVCKNSLKTNGHIFLVGFMGAGKTTIGRALAENLNRQFFDLDDLIVKRVEKSIPDIFRESGEAFFRELESQTLSDCKQLCEAVIALGGGAFVNEKNQQLTRGMGVSIWLDCPIATILTRIEFDGSRPLARNKTLVQELFNQRSSAYAQADLRIFAGEQTIDQIVEEIIKLLRNRR
ncbi:MAG: shikimate kinase [Acidobacteriota bacterium]